jgi:hypothetical protein
MEAGELTLRLLESVSAILIANTIWYFFSNYKVVKK